MGNSQQGSSLIQARSGSGCSRLVRHSYDSPVSALAGLVVEVDSNYNLTKNLSSLTEVPCAAFPSP